MGIIPIRGAEIYYDKNFLAAEEATKLFDILQRKCAWERRRTSFKSAVPRDEAYYGDPGTSYIYSRREYSPLAWDSGVALFKSTRRRGDSCLRLLQPAVAEALLQCRSLQSLQKR
jgi:hypothetical protein